MYTFQNSHIKWLGQIPAHWSLIPNKYLFTKRQVKVGKRFKDFQLLSLTTNGVQKKSIEQTKGKVPLSYEGYQIVKPNDMIFCLFDLDCSAVFSGLSKYTGMITSAYNVVECQKKLLNPNFSDYWFQYVFSQRYYKIYAQNVRYTITYDVFGSLKSPIPPLIEQEQIVKFLKWKLSQINHLISLKKKKLALLHEQKSIIINDVLTKGLGNNETQKSSIIGLDMIPKTWEEKALKWYVNNSIETLSATESPTLLINYIDIGTVGFCKLKKAPTRLIFKNAPSRARKIVQEGDTILSMVRTYLRSIYYIDKSLDGCIVSTGFAVLRPNANVYPQLLSYALSCNYFINSVIRNSVGASYPAISENVLLSLHIALPVSLQEQISLFNYIKQLTVPIDKEIQLTQKTISTLYTLKQEVIAATVTGQIDVRNIKIPQYEYTEEVDLEEQSPEKEEDMED